MLQKRLIIFIISCTLGLLVFLFSRSRNNDTNDNEASVVYSAAEEQDQGQAARMHVTVSHTAETEQKSNTPPSTLNPPYQAVLNFLRWYKDTYDAVYCIELIDTSGSFYRVNFEGTEAYLSLLEQSRYISPEYIKRWQLYFKKCDENFKITKQTDGPAEGFEFDFVLWTQTIDETLDAIDNPELLSSIEQNGTHVVKVQISMRLGFRLSQYGEAWKIDEIFNVSAEDDAYVR